VDRYKLYESVRGKKNTIEREDKKQRADGGGLDCAKNHEQKHRLVHRLNELVQGLGGADISIIPLTSQCCGVTVRAAIVAWEAFTASKYAKKSDKN